MSTKKSRAKKPLTQLEIAEAAILGDVALGMQVLGWLLSIGAAIQWLSVIPFALLVIRHRRRVVVFSVASVSLVGFLLGGATLGLQIYLAGAIGHAVGKTYVKRKHWSYAVFLSVLEGAVPVALTADLLLLIFTRARKLSLEQIQIFWSGAGKIIVDISNAMMNLSGGSNQSGSGFFYGIFKWFFDSGNWLIHSGNWVVKNWWYVFPLATIFSITLLSLVINWFTRLVVRQVIKEVGKPISDDTSAAVLIDLEPNENLVAPVPLELVNITHRYPNNSFDSIREINLSIEPGTLTSIIGSNGSGKSTLGKIIAGMIPSHGEIHRRGSVGVGRKGGTSMVFQRPESQVLGNRVEDDLVWGLSKQERVNVQIEQTLEKVGLQGYGGRETSALSGGELQRLALAAALVRDPKLVISDESTALLDQKGREAVMKVLKDISTHGSSVVHITHLRNEVIGSTQVLELEKGEIVSVDSATEDKPVGTNDGVSAFDGSSILGIPSTLEIGRIICEPLVKLVGVGHTHALGTPWAHEALRNVNMTINKGEGWLVYGDNGSGKSTLAWIISGLMTPSNGTIEWLEGQESDSKKNAAENDRVFNTGLVFQHARLQLVRSNVSDNVIPRDVKNPLEAESIGRSVLRAVGFMGPDIFHRKVSSLSGGELRRVAIASVLSAAPKLLVLDEPLAGLDEPSRVQVISVISSLQSQGIATLVVSHDFEYALEMADHFLQLESGSVVSISSKLIDTEGISNAEGGKDG